MPVRLVPSVPKKVKILLWLKRVEVQVQRVLLFVKLNPQELGRLPGKAPDVPNVGPCGTGNLELSVKSENVLDAAKPFMEMASEKAGG